jgi:hypothetical protein
VIFARIAKMTINKILREKYGLPDAWEVYKYQCIPKNEFTHIQLTGCLTSVFSKGKRKGQKKYTDELERTFIFSNAEYKELQKEAKV